MMVRNHSLVITNATTANTGHYLCSGVNTAGAAIERSQVTNKDICTGANVCNYPNIPLQLLVYNSADWSGGEGDLAAYHVPADTDTAEARVALMEKTVEVSRYFCGS